MKELLFISVLIFITFVVVNGCMVYILATILGTFAVVLYSVGCIVVAWALILTLVDDYKKIKGGK